MLAIWAACDSALGLSWPDAVALVGMALGGALAAWAMRN